MAKTIVTIAEQKYATVFLQYLHDHYSKAINPKDALLVEAVISWLHDESTSLAKIRKNNPFNLKSPDSVRIAAGKKRIVKGTTITYSSLTKGFQAAAKLLITGDTGGTKGYALALNALKQGGNSGAWNFLVALAMSKFDAG